MLLQYIGIERIPKIEFPTSKSISNRALIAFAVSGLDLDDIHNLSDAADTTSLYSLLSKKPSVCDVGPAGTTFRFLTACMALSGYEGVITGSERLQERPQKPLIEALRVLGADITYLGKDGFAPIKLAGFKDSRISRIEVDCSLSSQFLSGLILAAPLLKREIEIIPVGKLISMSYIQLTLEIFEQVYQTKIEFDGKSIKIPKVEFPTKHSITIPLDWSSVTYFFLIQDLVKKDIELPVFNALSFTQGDTAILDFRDQLHKRPKKLDYDFSNCPDMALTCIVWAAVYGQDVHFTGLSTLKNKESDRLAVVKENLKQFGVQVIIDNDEVRGLIGKVENFSSTKFIATSHDHRIAMAFAPLAFFGPLEIENPTVVQKSFPDFWLEIAKIGFYSTPLIYS